MCFGGTTSGDVVYLNDGRTVFGLYESEVEGNIHFRQRMEKPGMYEPRVFPRSDVRAMVVTVNRERLEALRPGEWSLWRDMADELAVQSADPEARDLALRLYLILARNAPEPMRKVAFSGAIEVAEQFPSRELIRRIRVLAWRESGGTGELPELPVSDQTPVVDAEEMRSHSRQLARALHDYRTGDKGALQSLMRDRNFTANMSAFATVCTAEQLPSIAAREAPDFSETSILIRLELAALAFADGKPPADVTRESPWSVLVMQNRPAPVPLDDSEIDGIDPLAIHFRDGKWYRPD
jgi:hypothetical protein